MIKWSACNNITKKTCFLSFLNFFKSNFPEWWVERDVNRESRFHYLLLLLFFVRISQLSPFSFVVSSLFFFFFFLFLFIYFFFFLHFPLSSGKVVSINTSTVQYKWLRSLINNAAWSFFTHWLAISAAVSTLLSTNDGLLYLVRND